MIKRRYKILNDKWNIADYFSQSFITFFNEQLILSKTFFQQCRVIDIDREYTNPRKILFCEYIFFDEEKSSLKPEITYIHSMSPEEVTNEKLLSIFCVTTYL